MTTLELADHGPETDPTPLFDLYRGQYATSLLVAASTEFRVFQHLSEGPLELSELRKRTQLEDRPMQVLITALRAMGTIVRQSDGRLALSPSAAEHMVEAGKFFVGDYFGLARDSIEVRELVRRFRTNRPKGADDAGTGFIFREGQKSAMEEADAARHFTLALAGRAKNVAPVLAQRIDLTGVRRLVDMGGGTGLYSLALLRRYPQLRAVVWDRPEVLRVAAEFADVSGVGDRLELQPGDFFKDPFPCDADAVLLSNILHDWDIPECRQLVQRAATVLRPGGKLYVHDVFLDDDLGGPLPAALYSANLFAVTEGRLYSAAEVRDWLQEVGLRPGELRSTLVHAQVLESIKLA